jgi:DNA-directed RNA polymerase specialized sigma24 family protein
VGILKNKVVDYYRKLGRETSFTDLEFLKDECSHKFVKQGFWNHDLGPHEWRPDADEVMHKAEFWQTMRDCLSKLPERVADVFMLREMDDVPSKEICRTLNISEGNLWSCCTARVWHYASVWKSRGSIRRVHRKGTNARTVQSVAPRQSLPAQTSQLAGDATCQVHRKAHPEMPGSRADPVARDG